MSTSLIARGVLAIIVGIIALAWPKVTILALVILFAIYAFIAAGLQAMRAFSSRKAGPVIGYLLLALIDVAAGVIALVWPGPQEKRSAQRAVHGERHVRHGEVGQAQQHDKIMTSGVLCPCQPRRYKRLDRDARDR